MSAALRRVLVVAEAEIARRLRSRAFLIGTLIGAVGLFAIVALPLVLGDDGGRASPAARPAGATAREAAQFAAFALVTVLYVGIVLNAQTISASVAEEKTSRIAEILASIVDPAELLVAKIASAFVSAGVQVAVWSAVGAAAAPLARALAHRPAATLAGGELLVAIAPPVLAAFAAAFAIGLAQFALVFAAAASLVNRPEDLGSVIGPMMLPVLGGFFGAQFAVASPHAAAVTTLSFVPLLAPFVMFARVAVSAVPVWQLALCVAVNVAALVALALLAGRVYRVGLLLYGRPPTVRQVIATLRG